MIFIAQRSEDGSKAGIKEIAAGIDSPEHFIAKILQDLGRNGLVQSTKGPNGGFYLDRAGRDCPLGKIVRIIDGDRLFTGCALGLKQCSETHPCPIHREFGKIRREIAQLLDSTRVGEFTEPLEEQQLFLRRK